MNDTSSKRKPGNVSRRDFLFARLWRHAAAESHGKGNAARATSKRNVQVRTAPVMRYPQTTADVESADQLDNLPAEAPPKLPPAAARRRTIPLFRPPGAIDEPSFLAGCTRCEDCINACPHNAIVHAPPQFREAAGTPTIMADRQPCLMCADFPCIAACKPQVLTHQVPVVMGTARITEHLCLPYHGTACSVCYDACPIANAMHMDNGRPVISELHCTGCGVCRAVCPAPENAVLLMPTFIRAAIESPTHE